MAETRATCKRCQATMTLQSVDPVCGQHGVLKVTLLQLPALVCPNMHMRFAVPDFPALLLERLAGEDMTKVPAGEKRGLLFKHYHCGACGAKLGSGEAREDTFDFDIALKGLSPFRVELTLPLYQCPACGKEQIRSLQELRKLAAPAMARAFEAAGLHPGYLSTLRRSGIRRSGRKAHSSTA